MMKHLVLLLILGFAACSGSTPVNADAAKDAASNLPFGATCVTVSDTSTECASHVCTDSFNMLGHNVCSVKCTFGNDATCPSGASGMKCNMKGYCKP